MTVVAIDAVHLRPGGKGVARVLANLTPRLLAREEVRIRYVALSTSAGAEFLGSQYGRGVVVVPEMLDSLWVHQALEMHARRAGADLLYLHREVGPLWGSPYILHVPEDPTARWARIPPGALRVRARATLDKATLRYSVRRACALVTSTCATASDLSRKFGIARSLFAVVPLGIDTAFLRAAHAPCERQHIFHLGSEDPRDNTLAVLRAYAWMRRHTATPSAPLVVAGDLGKLGGKATLLGYRAGARSVTILGRVSDEELYALYRGAVMCVQPSSDEGFGLEPLEAMAAGAPVVAVDTPVAREVLGTAAHLVSSPSPEVLGRAMDRLLSLPTLREELERKGMKHSRAYTWDRTADLLHGVVERVVAADMKRTPAT